MPHSKTAPTKMKQNWISGIGSAGGAAFSIGCPACVPALAALFSAMGLGFLINMKVLAPLTLGLLGLGIYGLHTNSKKHGRTVFVVVGLIASLAVFSSRYIIESNVTMYGGAAALLINAFLDYKHAKKKSCCKIK